MVLRTIQMPAQVRRSLQQKGVISPAAAYWKCPVATCYRVLSIEEAREIEEIPEEIELGKLCPHCNEPTDAPPHRRRHWDYRCEECKQIYEAQAWQRRKLSNQTCTA